MESIKSLELDILITISQNKKVPAEKFNQLFEYKWNVYRSVFEHLKREGLFRISIQSHELTSYELTSKGNVRMMELVNVRNEEIQIRLLQHKKIKPGIIVQGRKTLSGILHYLKGTHMQSNRMPNTEPERQ